MKYAEIGKKYGIPYWKPKHEEILHLGLFSSRGMIYSQALEGSLKISWATLQARLAQLGMSADIIHEIYPRLVLPQNHEEILTLTKADLIRELRGRKIDEEELIDALGEFIFPPEDEEDEISASPSEG